MSKGKKKLLIIIALLVFVVGGYKWRYPTYAWHQKLTIEVDTPQGVKSGSSVVAVSWSKVPKLLPDMHYAQHEITGEATMVDLGDGRYLFALLKGASTLAQRAFVMPSVGYFTDAWLYPASKVRASMGKKAIIREDHRPLLVTFTDINDPKTVKRVNPDDLAATFGEGHTLKNITLEITSEPVTKGVVENFGFMKMLEIQSTLSGLEKYDKRFADQIYYLTDKAFIRGVK